MMPDETRQGLRYIQKQLNLYALQFFGLTPFLSSIYFAFNPSFTREHHGVIYGKLRYFKMLKEVNANNFLLRRNIHRLEKGLISQPRRDIFALNYILETVESYVYLANKENEKAFDVDSDHGELKWAHDVLEQYFKLSGEHMTISKALEHFRTVKQSSENDKKFMPYQRDLQQDLPVSYESLLALSYRRRSVRWYLPKAVPRELIDKAIKVAVQSPSACNRLPFEFRVFDDPEMVSKVSAIPGGTLGFHHNFPAVIVVIGKLNAYYAEMDRHLIYIDASLAAMSLIFAFETLELSSCPINWPDVPEKEMEMRKMLALKPDERPIMLISVGYPDPNGMVPYSQKKELDQVRVYNKTN